MAEETRDTRAMKYERMKENLVKLKLKDMADSLDMVLEKIQSGVLDKDDLLLTLTETELKAREKRRIKHSVDTANFPFMKTLDDFDYGFQPFLSREMIIGYKDLRFLDCHQNIVLTGPAGVGKTHIAVGIGIEASMNGNSTYYIDARKLLKDLKKAEYEKRIENRIRKLKSYKLLIIDGLAYLPVGEEETRQLFELISERHARKSTIVISNRLPSEWGKKMGDPQTVEQMIDLLADYESRFIHINGPSYRRRHLANIEDDPE